MLIVIPTFNRIDRLRYTLLTLVRAVLPDSCERFVVCLANNHPATTSKIHEVVDEIKQQSKDSTLEWLLLDREKTLYPIDNWYSAIADLATDGEVVFLHGDDDLFLPWSLVDRYRAITETKADMLMSETAHNLSFLPDENSVYYPNSLPHRKNGVHALPISWKDIAGWGPAFIGNHCYRYTNNFRQAMALSFEWCHQQDWLDWNTRTLMLPYYLPFAVKQIGGKLTGIRQTCVIRGHGLSEVSKAPFGVPGWNSGFLALCAYGVLTNKELGSNTALESARLGLVKMASEWFCTFFFDKRILPQIRKETLQRIQLPNFSVFSKSFLRSLRMVLFDKLRLRRIRSRSRLKHKQAITDFLELIKKLD